MEGGIPAQELWKRVPQPQHSSSGKPVAPGQYGVQGAADN